MAYAIDPGDAMMSKMDSIENSSQRGINATDPSKPFSFDALSKGQPSLQTTKISERQKDWDLQARNADEKQAELFHTQWNLIREQMRIFSNEMISVRTELKTFKEEVNACFEQADYARESGDDALRVQLEELAVALEKENKQRTFQCSEIEKIVAGLRSGLDTATSQQAILERSIANLSDEVRQMEARLRSDMEVEPRARQEAFDRLRAELQQATATTSRALDIISHKLDSSIEELHEALRRENAERVVHIQERITFNSEEIQRITRDNKQMIEKEFHERRQSDGVINAQMQNLLGTLDKDRAERDTIFASFRAQLNELKQDLNSQNPENSIRELKAMIESEAKKRAEGDGASSNALSRLQAQLEGESRERARILPDITDRLKLLADAIDAEVTKRASRISEVDNALRMMIEQEGKVRGADRVHCDEELSRLRAEVDAEVRSRQEALARASIELHEALKPLTEAINREVQERHAGDEEAVRLALQAKQACEKEAHDRALDHTKITDSLKDLARNLDQERTDREKAEVTLHAQITDTRQELEAEKGERRDEAATLGRAIRSVESAASSGLKELRGALEAESGERKEENKNLTSNMSRLKTQVEAESRELARIQGELCDRMRGLADGLALETQDRKEADGEIERAFRDLSVAFDQEARQREQAFHAVHDAIKSEVMERVAGDESAAKNLKAAMMKMEGLVESLREVLWTKMLSLTDRFASFGREWRESPPAVDVISQMSSGQALRDEPRREHKLSPTNSAGYGL